MATDGARIVTGSIQETLVGSMAGDNFGREPEMLRRIAMPPEFSFQSIPEFQNLRVLEI